jgi:hypothetical protein
MYVLTLVKATAERQRPRKSSDDDAAIILNATLFVYRALQAPPEVGLQARPWLNRVWGVGQTGIAYRW